ncbi:biotin transporter BioY [Salana multivorans]
MITLISRNAAGRDLRHRRLYGGARDDNDRRSGRPPVLADLLPAAGSRARSLLADAVLVVAGTLVVAGLSQVLVPLPFTPVPLSRFGTFGVLLVGAGLGPLRATASLAIYVLAGIAGVGWFAGGASGWQFASFGYLLGMVLAAALVGALARRGADRSVWRTTLAGLLAGAVVYALGVPWLMLFLDVDLPAALALLGVVPFLVGDAIKALLAAILLPSTWALVNRLR